MQRRAAAFARHDVLSGGSARARHRAPRSTSTRARAQALEAFDGEALEGSIIGKRRMDRRSTRASGAADGQRDRAPLFDVVHARAPESSSPRGLEHSSTWQRPRAPEEHLAAFHARAPRWTTRRRRTSSSSRTGRMRAASGASEELASTPREPRRCGVTVAIPTTARSAPFTELASRAARPLARPTTRGDRCAAHRGQGRRTARRSSSRCTRLRDELIPRSTVVATPNAEAENAAVRRAQRSARASARDAVDRRPRAHRADRASAARLSARASQPDRPPCGPGLVRPARRPLRVPLDPLQRPQAPDRRGVSSCWLSLVLITVSFRSTRARRRAGDGRDRAAAVRGRRRPGGAAVPRRGRLVPRARRREVREQEAARAERGAAAAADPRRGALHRTSQLRRRSTTRGRRRSRTSTRRHVRRRQPAGHARAERRHRAPARPTASLWAASSSSRSAGLVGGALVGTVDA